MNDDFRNYYYFLAPLGRKNKSVAARLLGLLLREWPLPDRLPAVMEATPSGPSWSEL